MKYWKHKVVNEGHKLRKNIFGTVQEMFYGRWLDLPKKSMRRMWNREEDKEMVKGQGVPTPWA